MENLEWELNCTIHRAGCFLQDTRSFIMNRQTFSTVTDPILNRVAFKDFSLTENFKCLYNFYHVGIRCVCLYKSQDFVYHNKGILTNRYFYNPCNII